VIERRQLGIGANDPVDEAIAARTLADLWSGMVSRFRYVAVLFFHPRRSVGTNFVVPALDVVGLDTPIHDTDAHDTRDIHALEIEAEVNA
jgi:hypothetical protein